ncbi:MAG: hypothetical protein ABFD46_11135 [Armatimonadota bacterium]
MSNYSYAASARRLMLTAAVMLILVLCVGTVSYAQSTVTGTVTRGGIPCPNVRVVITDDITYSSGRTGADGTYTIEGSPMGISRVIFNAVNAVPKIIYNVDILANPIQNADLQYGYTPLVDDFSSAEVDTTNRWSFFNAYPYPDASAPDSTVSITSQGWLQITASRKRGGIKSITTFPSIAAFECTIPQKATTGYMQQGMGIKGASSDLTQLICIEDQASSSVTVPYINCCYGTDSTSNPSKVWSPTSMYWGSAYQYPCRLTILRTMDDYDYFINGTWLAEKTFFMNIADNAYLYLYGISSSSTSTALTNAFFDDVRAGAGLAIAATTVSGAKTTSEGDMVTIPEAVVTASFPGCFWIENTDRSSGIKVICNASSVAGENNSPAIGDKVLVSGKIIKSNSEISIYADNIVYTGRVTPPAPVGITGKVAAECNKAGAAAQGLFVKIAGNITHVDTDATNYVTGYCLDDGSGVVTTVGLQQYKGIYVIMDPAFKYTTDDIKENDFQIVSGPLTIYANSGVPVPAVKSIPVVEPAAFKSYNDFFYSSTSALAANNSTCTAKSGLSKCYLIDYATGKALPVNVALTSSGLRPETTGGPTAFATGTDAYNIFNGKVNTYGGLIHIDSNVTNWFAELEFSGLNPGSLYTFACTGAKSSTTTGVSAIYTISGARSFINSSSSGAVMSADGYSTTITNVSNMTNGFIAKWSSIQPSVDGRFKLRVVSTSPSSSTGYPLTAFMLQKQ